MPRHLGPAIYAERAGRHQLFVTATVVRGQSTVGDVEDL